jgi:CopG family nickel-responsive transcriptional regulator
MTITLDDDLVADFEEYLADHGYRNRSEAVRDLIRNRIEEERLEKVPGGHCVANLTNVFKHHERDLAHRLAQGHHTHHDLNVATLHVHLDHDNCLESVVLRGPVEKVQAFANVTIARPGVRHGRLCVMPVEISEQTHTHGADSPSHRHLHVQPTS